MTKIPVLKSIENSANLDAIGHHEGRLWIRFKGKPTVYSYGDVPADLHQEMLGAKSPGGVFHAKIKGKFQHTKHEPKA